MKDNLKQNGRPPNSQLIVCSYFRFQLQKPWFYPLPRSWFGDIQTKIQIHKSTFCGSWLFAFVSSMLNSSPLIFSKLKTVQYFETTKRMGKKRVLWVNLKSHAFPPMLKVDYSALYFILLSVYHNTFCPKKISQEKKR